MAEMKKQKQKARMFGIASLAVFVGATLLIVFAMSKTIAEVREVAVSNSSDIILANAGLKENEGVNLQVSYFDQRADECVNVYDDTQMALLKEKQFGWFECGYYNERLEQGMVGFELDERYLPIAKGGDLITNRGLFDMSRWFSEVEGKSKAFIGTIRLDYSSEDASFSFHQNSFYPLDKVEYDKSENVNKDGHNHLFTMNFAVPFTVLTNGNESFMVTADDDTFVYVGDKLVLDMGGIHDAMSGEVAILDNGEVHSGIGGAELAYSGVNVQHGDSSIVRIFHADRNEEDSVFKMTFVGMNLGVVDTRLADGDDGGVQIAYDPNDPSYVAPLGESSVVKPDTTKGYAILATIEGVVVVALAFLVVFSAKLIIVRKTK
ncbi:hypothetical protein IKF04_00585 [Candidatus Saccharibacteria bacterium]|nr:hypothetical protein [Candidatus Saccharibacteria bacterium]